ncbi:MAG: hypothetical protein IPK19_38895 [Chloroflexi bacterium]|nr:hypothetical protein [Chloroflexota bacterium]
MTMPPGKLSAIGHSMAWSRPFLRMRQEQIALLDQLAAIDWEAPRETIWGYKPLSMVVTKTYQHTFEHGNTLLKMGLWWANFERG